MAAQHYDAVVIGAGQAGVPLSQALARSGRRTALIEREHVGGTCINEGCTPTKTMVASAKTAYVDRRSADYGVHNGPVAVDMPEVRGRKRAMVDSFRNRNLRRIDVRVATIPMTYVTRAVEMGETRGFMKAVVDAETAHTLGCAVLGIEEGEIMAMIQIAMMGNLPYTVLCDSEEIIRFFTKEKGTSDNGAIKPKPGEP